MGHSLRVRLTAGLLAVAFVASMASVLLTRVTTTGQWNSIVVVVSSIGVFSILVGISFALATYFEQSARRAFQRVQEQSEIEATHLTRLKQLNSELHEQNAVQSAAATETSAAVHELQETVQKNNETARHARVSSEASRQAAENGQRSVINMTAAFTELSDTARKLVDGLKESSSDLDELVSLIGQISEKTKAIDEIVFQTRILSFNASVEAARAGEHGRGFAVVAEEVGSLAQMSGRAAAEISSILRLGVEKAKLVSEAARGSADRFVDETKNSADIGLSRSEECKAALGEILRSVEQVNGAIDTVSRSTEEQTIGIGEIAKAITQIESANMKTVHVVGEIESEVEKIKSTQQGRESAMQGLRGNLLGAQTLLAPAGPSGSLEKVATVQPEVRSQVRQSPKVVKIEKNITPKPKAPTPVFKRRADVQQKKVVGMDYPSATDSRFEDV